MTEGDPIDIFVESIFGQRADRALVQVSIGEQKLTLTLSPSQAREIAGTLLACAEAATGDELFLRFFRDRLGMEMPQVVRLMRDFRHLREEFDARPAPGTSREEGGHHGT